MSQQARALVIGLLGPSLQAVGVVWDLLEHAVFARSDVGHLTLTHILTGPAHLMIFTGFALCVVCIPIALQVAAARTDQLESLSPNAEAAEELQGSLGVAEAAE